MTPEDFGFVDREASADDDEDIFSLHSGVGPGRPNRRADVLKVETLLANTADHDIEEGATGYSGSGLVDAIRNYQKRRNLRVDGILLPGGETIAALERELRQKYSGFRAPTPGEADEHINRIGRGEVSPIRVTPPLVVLHEIPDLPPVDADAHQSNGRMVRALLQTRDNRVMAEFLAKTVESPGFAGIAHVRDFIEQLRALDRKRADAMTRAVFEQLSEKSRREFAGGEQPEQQPIGVVPKGRPRDATGQRPAGAAPSPAGPSGAPQVQGAASLSPKARQAALRLIGHHEGIKEKVYDDGVGNPTIGYGFNLNRTDAPQRLKSLGLDYAAVRAGRQLISEPQAAILRDLVIDEVNKDLDQLEKSLPQPLTENQRVALLSLGYNSPALLGPALRAALQRGDLRAAENEIRNRSNKQRNSALGRGLQIRREREADVFAGKEKIP